MTKTDQHTITEPYCRLASGGIVTSANSMWLKETGWSEEDIIGKNFNSIISSTDHKKLERAFKGFKRKSGFKTLELVTHFKSGKTKKVEWYLILKDKDQYIAIINSIKKDSIRINTTTQIAALLGVAENVVGLGFWHCSDVNGRIFWSDGAHKILDIDTSCRPQNLKDFRAYLSPQSTADLIEFAKRFDRNETFECKFKVESKYDFETHIILLQVKSVKNSEFPDGCLFGIMRDVTVYEETMDHLAHIASHDPLTSLANRRFLSKHLKTLLERSKKEKINIAILHLDLDKFKEINDTYGHAIGDNILCHAAETMQNNVAKNEFLARVGGDEFVIVVNDYRDMTQLTDLASRLIADISKPLMHDAGRLQIGASIGIATLNLEEPQNPDVLLSNADIALYEAKNSGRQKYTIFNQQMRNEIEFKSTLLQALQEGLDNDQIVPFFQPQIDCVSEKLIGMESLARWYYPGHGIITPESFLPIAFENKKGSILFEVILNQSLQALCHWREQGFNVPRVSINLESSQLGDEKLAEKISSKLKEYKLKPSDIAIEVLETVLLDDKNTEALDTIKKIKKLGCYVELDDFGTGHASISNLMKFKVDRIKIDKSFIRKIDQNKNQQMIVKTLIELAKNLNIDCLVEGVENKSEQSMVVYLGCNSIQGFIVAEPMPFSDTTKWLAKTPQSRFEQLPTLLTNAKSPTA